jgi:hypothetical protein
MGLIIKDTIMLDSGLQVTNAYANIGTEAITIRKHDSPPAHDPPTSTKIYSAYARVHIWANKEIAAKKNNDHILKSYIVSVQEEHGESFNENIYSLLYTKFKTDLGYTCEDDN